MPPEVEIKDAEMAALTVLVVAATWEIHPAEIRGSSRKADVVFARHFAMWFLRCRKGLTSQALAQFFHRCTCDVNYAIACINERIELNQNDEGKLTQLADQLESIIDRKLNTILELATDQERIALCA